MMNVGDTAPSMSSRPRRNAYDIIAAKRASQHSSAARRKRGRGSRSRSRQRRRQHYDSSSESSRGGDGSDSDEDGAFARYQKKSWARDRDTIQPLNGGGGSAGATDRDMQRADVCPIEVDQSITWESVGGLGHHVRALKELVTLPLLYPEVFTKFGTTPPRGVLFYGPPGCGKTLMARALANSCSQGGKRVAFFMRKGADCLSKWVGEAERQLRLLFDQARAHQPSIIFFDEIDGLAPVRSAKQDQIHASIVSTLLALMDGLDERGQVIVIGATNRPDAIDPALRRPGRFDRELSFSLPDHAARLKILQIHTKTWEPPVPPELASELARRCVGYCGADMKALCSEAALHALRRHYPQIYSSDHKLVLDASTIEVERCDFAAAMEAITPASHRCAVAHTAPLAAHLQPLLAEPLNSIKAALAIQLPQAFQPKGSVVLESSDSEVDAWRMRDGVHRPRMMIEGQAGEGQAALGAAVLHAVEALPTIAIDLPSLLADASQSPESALVRFVTQARRSAPAVIYIPDIQVWWTTELASMPLLRSTLVSLVEGLPDNLPVLVMATWEKGALDGDSSPPPKFIDALRGSLSARSELTEVCELTPATEEQRRKYLTVCLEHIVAIMQTRLCRREATGSKEKTAMAALPIAPMPVTRKEDKTDDVAVNEKREHTLRELRIFLRAVLHELRKDRRYAAFCYPVDVEEVTDYLSVVKNPMDLDTMRTKCDMEQYVTLEEFNEDLELIRANAQAYNPCGTKDARGRAIVSSASNMIDNAASMVYRFRRKLGYDLFAKCKEYAKQRRKVTVVRSTVNYAAKEVVVADPYAQVPGSATSRGERSIRRGGGEMIRLGENGKVLDQETWEEVGELAKPAPKAKKAAAGRANTAEEAVAPAEAEAAAEPVAAVAVAPSHEQAGAAATNGKDANPEASEPAEQSNGTLGGDKGVQNESGVRAPEAPEFTIDSAKLEEAAAQVQGMQRELVEKTAGWTVDSLTSFRASLIKVASAACNRALIEKDDGAAEAVALQCREFINSSVVA
ncbi:unnamed protein product [Chrysoparadoxa australica]